ncbi:MAG: hypothetical protein ACI9H1_001013, partial [Polaribacter sp.]
FSGDLRIAEYVFLFRNKSLIINNDHRSPTKSNALLKVQLDRNSELSILKYSLFFSTYKSNHFYEDSNFYIKLLIAI